MTIPKHAGLSHLADVARRDGEQILHSYPMKKKGEPRRLLPNQAGIEWLESDANDFALDTGIADILPMNLGDPEFLVEYAVGRTTRRYPRPMFQVIPRDAFSGAQQSVTPCSCDRWDLSWDAARCERHAEVEWDTERKVWKRPGADAPCAYYDAAAESTVPEQLRATSQPPSFTGILGGQWVASDGDVWQSIREADTGSARIGTLRVEGSTLQGVDIFEIVVGNVVPDTLEVRPNDRT